MLKISPIQIEFKYKLRWRFDFATKPTRRGLWLQAGTQDSDKACFVNKDGLIRASIEAENVQTYELKTLAECVGPDFCNFEWDAVVSVPGFVRSAITQKGHIIGLRIVSRDFNTIVYVNGDVHVKPRTEEDKQFHLAGYGK